MLPASLNITNTIIGGGLLEMPFIMQTFGIFMTFGILILQYTLTLMSLKLLLKVKYLLMDQDYYKISLKTFRQIGGWIVKICLLTNNLGVSAGYLIIFLDSTSKLLSEAFDVS